jgi:tRNA-dihydrouridine synthase B
MSNHTGQDIQIGPYRLDGQVLLAPMAGISDVPFRNLCHDFGVSLSVTEMTTSDTALWTSAKSRHRLQLNEIKGIRAVQIAGSEPLQMADAARAATELGAQIIDINMGCPAKKVCRKLSGSALLRDEELVKKILVAVVAATDVPVTLKTRTGWDKNLKNGVRIAQLAESVGIQALAIHGRTRACAFRGKAEYDTIRAIKNAVKIPIIANGDIDSPESASEVIRYTGADGIMVGRAARGKPWLLQQISDQLKKNIYAPPPSIETRRDIIIGHLDAMYRFYGEYTGVRVARKHLGWYLQELGEANQFRKIVVRAESSCLQMQLTKDFFRHRLQGEEAVTAHSSPPGVSHQWRKQKEQEYHPGNQTDRAKFN